MLPTLLFPTVFYLLFGVLLARSRGGEAGRYLLATYGMFGVMAPGLFGFGVSLAIERESGLLTLKRALPMPPGAYLFGKMVDGDGRSRRSCSTLLVLLAVFVAHVPLHRRAVRRCCCGRTCSGVLPFCALGLLLGTLVNGQGAPAVVNMLYLPMAFLSGLWLPLHEPAEGDAVDRARASELPSRPLALDAVDIAQVNAVAAHRDRWRRSPSACRGSRHGACARSASIRAMDTGYKAGAAAAPIPPRIARLLARCGFAPAPDSAIADLIRQGKSPWTERSTCSGRCGCSSPRCSAPGYTWKWVALTAVSYPVFIALYAKTLLSSRRVSDRYAYGMALLCFVLLPWYPSGISYFVFGCVMLHAGKRHRAIPVYLVHGRCSTLLYAGIVDGDGLSVADDRLDAGDDADHRA